MKKCGLAWLLGRDSSLFSSFWHGHKSNGGSFQKHVSQPIWRYSICLAIVQAPPPPPPHLTGSHALPEPIPPPLCFLPWKGATPTYGAFTAGRGKHGIVPSNGTIFDVGSPGFGSPSCEASVKRWSAPVPSQNTCILSFLPPFAFSHIKVRNIVPRSSVPGIFKGFSHQRTERTSRNTRGEHPCIDRLCSDTADDAPREGGG